MTFKNNSAPLLYHIKLCASFQSHEWIQTRVTVQQRSIRVKITWEFCPVWPWNLMNDLKKQKGTSSILCQALHIISKPSVNSNCSYSLETLNSGQNWWYFLPLVTLKFYRCPWKTIGHLFYAASSFVHHFIAIGELKLELQSGQNLCFF